MINPLVSVIVPNYNHARYLEQRLDTVFNQTYQNFEVIILDDKSTDNSLEIINRYKDNPHLSQIVVNEQNTGSPFKQWDKGINLAKGELVWIAESDDYNELTFLEELVTEWGKHKDVVVAFSNYVQFWDDSYSYYKERATQCFCGKKYIKYRQARGNHLLNASGVIFLKNVYKKVGKEFMKFRNAGDYMFWTSILNFGSVLKVNKNLTYWRRLPTSVTGTSERKGITACEDKYVFDYINDTYKLNCWQKLMAYGIRLTRYSECQYESEDIKQYVYKLWDESNHKWHPSSFLLWVISSLERHANIIL